MELSRRAGTKAMPFCLRQIGRRNAQQQASREDPWMRGCAEEPVSEAVETLQLLVHQGLYVPTFVLYRFLRTCMLEKDIAVGSFLHSLVVASGYEGDKLLANHTIRMFTSHGRLQEALQVFRRFNSPNTFLWSSIISANVQCGQPVLAVEMYWRMRQSSVMPDNHVFVAVLNACASTADVTSGRQVHADVLTSPVKPDVFVGSSLVDMYAKCGSLDDARVVFDNLATKNEVTWSAMLAGYSQHGQGTEVLNLYASMQNEGITPADHITFVYLLKACASTGALLQGKQLHAEIRVRGLGADAVVSSCLIDMYAKCGSMKDARWVFDNLAVKNGVTWNAMLAGYAQYGHGEEALTLFEDMPDTETDHVTFLCLFKACASIGAIDRGKQLHARAQAKGLAADKVVGSCLVDMYAKCGSLDEARRVFDSLGTKDVVSWNAMLTGYVQQGAGHEALNLYAIMQQEGFIIANQRTFPCLITACGSIGALDQGHQLHAQIREKGLETDLIISSCLIDMYSKCGVLSDACRVFDVLSTKDVVTWNVMLAAYGHHGLGEEALQCYAKMLLEGVSPDEVTFLSLLCACSHSGLVDQGFGYFESMSKVYGLTPSIEHYVSMIDICGRAGHLTRVQELLQKMPMQPDLSTWLSVLGACRKHGNVVLGKRAFDCAIHVEPKNPSAYMLMSHIYADAGMMDCAKKLWSLRVTECAWKEPGLTWITLDQQSHTFTAGSQGDSKHEEVYDMLQQITIRLKARYPSGLTSIPRRHYCTRRENWLAEKEGSVSRRSEKHAEQAQIRLIAGNTSSQGCHNLANPMSKKDSRPVYGHASDMFEATPLASSDFCWSKLCEQGQLSQAVHLLDQLLDQRSCVSISTIYEILKSCISKKDLVAGSIVHALVLISGYGSNVFLSNHIIRMYASHGRLEEALQVFASLDSRNAYSWSSIISAHVEHGQHMQAVNLYWQMRQSPVMPDQHTFVAALKACAGAADLASGRQVHADVVNSGMKLNLFVGSCLVDMYSKCGRLSDARKVFDSLATKDVVTWNAMLAAYVRDGLGQDVLTLYAGMQQEGIARATHATFVCLLKACGSIGALDHGRQIHRQLQERRLDDDPVVGSALVDMYAKCGSLDDARAVFDKLAGKDVVTWNTILAGYVQHGFGHDALSLYTDMQQEGMTPADDVTTLCVLKACAMVGALDQGKQLHAQVREMGLEADVVIGMCLVDMYAKCGSLEDARKIFDSLATRDVVTWTAMLAGYAQHGLGREALTLYESMHAEGTTNANHVTFVCLLKACTSIGSLEQGKQLHARIQEERLAKDAIIGSCLLDMYSKCGSLSDACTVFNNLATRDVVTWNAMLAAYAHHGLGDEALRCYEQMQLAGTRPTGATFLSLLSACSHAGLVDQGVEHFESMSRDHAISPDIEHYVSLMDLYGRSGDFSKVKDILSTMPMQPDLATWLCVMAACRKHGNVELGERAFWHAVHLQPKHASAYILMSHIYSGAGLFDKAKYVDIARRREGAWKEPGQSRIEYNRETHNFVAGDCNHPELEVLHELLHDLSFRLKEAGFNLQECQT